jgi:Zn-finger nucleic acid-binding protein
MSQTSLPINFRFQYVNQSGNAMGWGAKKASLTEETIQLKDSSLSYKAILDSTCRDRRMVLTLDPLEVRDPEVSQHIINKNLLILDITQAKPIDLERVIDRISSRYIAERHGEQLEREGKGREFRVVTCPHCDATVDVSLLNQTPYVYCRYCETIFQERGNLKTIGEQYRLCDECGWFDRVQGYTEFYFYFLLVIYGFRWQRRHLCDTCVNGLFWKMLAINFIFILGIFPTIWLKIQSLKGRDRDLKELAKANSLGKRGKYQEAEAIYTRLFERYPHHPGLLLSQGFGHLKGQDGTGAWHKFQKSLQGCSNYAPTVRTMNRIQAAASQSSQPK